MNSSAISTIRRCHPYDAETMAMVHALVLPSGWSAEEFETLLKSAGVIGYLAVNEQGYACGLLLLRSVVDECEILTLGVLYEMQRRGIATHMLKDATLTLQAQGIRMLHLEVQEDNVDAIKFYEAFGFMPVGRRKDYYATRDGRKDAILMRRTIV